MTGTVERPLHPAHDCFGRERGGGGPDEPQTTAGRSPRGSPSTRASTSWFIAARGLPVGPNSLEPVEKCTVEKPVLHTTLPPRARRPGSAPTSPWMWNMHHVHARSASVRRKRPRMLAAETQISRARAGSLGREVVPGHVGGLGATVLRSARPSAGWRSHHRPSHPNNPPLVLRPILKLEGTSIPLLRATSRTVECASSTTQ